MKIYSLFNSIVIGNFACLFFFIITSTQVQSQDWQRFKSDSFDILLPKFPEKRMKNLNTELGMLPSISYSVKPEDSDPNFFYSINIVEYPEDIIHADSVTLIDTMIVASVDQLCTILKSKKVYASVSKYNGHHSYVFRLMDDLSGQVVKGRAVFAYNRMYSFMVFTLKDKSLNDNIDKFFNSLRFL